MYQRVLVGTDGSATGTRAVEAATRLAASSGAALTVAHAYRSRPTPAQHRAWQQAPEDFRWRLSVGSVGESTLDAAVATARAACPWIDIDGRFEPGPAVRVLLRLVDQIDPDVLVIGNRDMRGRPRLSPSVGRALSRRAPCDVVIVDTAGRRQQRRAAVQTVPLLASA